jgi:hypothetical protein
MLDELIIGVIRLIFQSESIKEEIIDRYLEATEKIKFRTSKNRKFVSGVTRATIEARHIINYLDNSQLLNLTMVQKVADTLCSSLTEKDEYIRPSEELIKDLKEYFNVKDINKSPDEKFNALSKESREEAINKVYCSNCGVTKIVDYDIIENEDGIYLLVPVINAVKMLLR